MDATPPTFPCLLSDDTPGNIGLSRFSHLASSCRLIEPEETDGCSAACMMSAYAGMTGWDAAFGSSASPDGKEPVAGADDHGCPHMQPHQPFPACFQVTRLKSRVFRDFGGRISSRHRPSFIAMNHVRISHACSDCMPRRYERGQCGGRFPHTCPCKPFYGVIDGVSCRIRISYRIHAYMPSESRFFFLG